MHIVLFALSGLALLFGFGTTALAQGLITKSTGDFST